MDKQEAIEMIKKLQRGDIDLCEFCSKLCDQARVSHQVYTSATNIICFCSDFEEK